MVCTLTMPRATLSHTKVSEIIGTRDNVTIISANTYPKSWPTTAVGPAVAGLGGTTQCYLRSKPVLVKNPEGQTATIHPYVTAAHKFPRYVLKFVIVFIVIVDLHPTGIIGQWDTQWSDPLYILKQIFFPH